MDFLDCLSEPEVQPAEIIPAPQDRPLTQQEKANIVLDGLQDSIYNEALQVIDDCMHFADVEPDELDPKKPPPKEWVAAIGIKAARRRARCARYALLPKKDAPIAVSLAAGTVASISAARARTNQGPKTLNVQVVQLSGPMPALEILEVEK